MFLALIQLVGCQQVLHRFPRKIFLLACNKCSDSMSELPFLIQLILQNSMKRKLGGIALLGNEEYFTFVPLLLILQYLQRKVATIKLFLLYLFCSSISAREKGNPGMFCILPSPIFPSTSCFLLCEIHHSHLNLSYASALFYTGVVSWSNIFRRR